MGSVGSVTLILAKCRAIKNVSLILCNTGYHNVPMGGGGAFGSPTGQRHAIQFKTARTLNCKDKESNESNESNSIQFDLI